MFSLSKIAGVLALLPVCASFATPSITVTNNSKANIIDVATAYIAGINTAAEPSPLAFQQYWLDTEVSQHKLAVSHGQSNNLTVLEKQGGDTQDGTPGDWRVRTLVMEYYTEGVNDSPCPMYPQGPSACECYINDGLLPMLYNANHHYRVTISKAGAYGSCHLVA